ncbi:MAG: hypothetical protein J6C41_07755, partial [Oscillospiraceae bacterium]|nr:hypothetical protein [Oscillospiraceae bacterium]
VQIPFLTGRTRNRLERLLSVFDQEYRQPDSEHYLEINDEYMDEEVKYVVHRLLKAAAAPAVRRAMEIEDEILSEIEDRDTTIMLKNKVIEEKEQMIEQKEQMIEQNKQVIEQKEQMIRSMVKMLCNNGASMDEISEQLGIPMEQIKQYIDS